MCNFLIKNNNNMLVNIILSPNQTKLCINVICRHRWESLIELGRTFLIGVHFRRCSPILVASLSLSSSLRWVWKMASNCQVAYQQLGYLAVYAICVRVKWLSRFWEAVSFYFCRYSRHIKGGTINWLTYCAMISWLVPWKKISSSIWLFSVLKVRTFQSRF